MNQGKAILDVRNLHTSFSIQGNRFDALRGVDLSVYEGEILGVVGESGSGKSVTMKSIIRMLPDSAQISADKIEFDGQSLINYPEKEMRKVRGNQISMIFQDPMTSLNPLKKVGYHIEEVLIRHRKLTKAQAKAEAIELLRKVGVPAPEERIKQYPHEFSGGMRQRVLIAMALACKPRLLIADEPTTALDVTIQAQILELIKELQEKDKMSVVLITHDLGVVANLCHRIAVMYGGMIMEVGTTDEIFYQSAHPYTKALLRSIPSDDPDDDSRLVPIEGFAPSLMSPPPGCPFVPRCNCSCDSCNEGICGMVQLSDTHFVRCFRQEEVNGNV